MFETVGGVLSFDDNDDVNEMSWMVMIRRRRRGRGEGGVIVVVVDLFLFLNMLVTWWWRAS